MPKPLPAPSPLVVAEIMWQIGQLLLLGDQDTIANVQDYLKLRLELQSARKTTIH